jgi:broad specificity phosphatase PhoE
MTLLLGLLRHAETEWSRDKRVQGHTDVPLSDDARAWLSRHRLPKIANGMAVASSPLVRCTETAKYLGLEQVAIEPRLVEMSWGQWEGRRLAQLRGELGASMATNEARGLDFMPPQGESPRQVLARVRPWLAELAQADRPTLGLAHRGVIRVIFAAATGWDMLGRPPAKLDWACLHVFALDASGTPSVHQLNLPLDAIDDVGMEAP